MECVRPKRPWQSHSNVFVTCALVHLCSRHRRASAPKRAAGKSWAILGTSPEWFDQNFINLVSLFDGTGFLDFVKKRD